MASQKIPFGLLNGRMVSPSDVPNGLACGCICAACGGRLIAKHPRTNIVDHFSHHNPESCATGYETALHLAAKQILMDKKKILLPGFNVEASRVHYDTFSRVEKQLSIPSKMVELDKVVEEVRDYQGVIPDIVATVGNKLLFIEIAVTHFVDATKLERLELLGHPTLEIDLSDAPRIPSLEDVEQLVIYELINKDWLVNSKRKAMTVEIGIQADAELQLQIDTYKANIQRKEQEKLEYKNLNDLEKFDLDFKSLNVSLNSIEQYIGLDVKCSYSIKASSRTWQLSVLREFVCFKQPWTSFDTTEVYKWISERFQLVETEKFPDAPKIAIHYYMKLLVEMKVIEKGYSRGEYNTWKKFHKLKSMA